MYGDVRRACSMAIHSRTTIVLQYYTVVLQSNRVVQWYYNRVVQWYYNSIEWYSGTTIVLQYSRMFVRPLYLLGYSVTVT